MRAGWFVDAARNLVVVAQAQSGAGNDPAPLPTGTTGFGVQLFQSAIALVGVCFAAWFVLRWMARRGYGTGANRNLRVIERVMLEPRRSVYLIEAGKRVFLVGSSDQSVTTLAELSRDDLTAKPDAPGEAPNPAARFADVLARIKKTATPPPRSAAERDPGEALSESEGE